MSLVGTLAETSPPALPLYKPRDDNDNENGNIDGGSGSLSFGGTGSGSVSISGSGGDGEVPPDVVAAAEQQTAVVGDVHARLRDLRAAAEAWGEEARAALRERERGLHPGGGGGGGGGVGVKGSSGAIEALLARDVVQAVQVGCWVDGGVFVCVCGGGFHVDGG